MNRRKNEFYFATALLTPNRKNYADLQILQEGNIIPEDSRMAIMGLIGSPFIMVTWCLNLLKLLERAKSSLSIYMVRKLRNNQRDDIC